MVLFIYFTCIVKAINTFENTDTIGLYQNLKKKMHIKDHKKYSNKHCNYKQKPTATFGLNERQIENANIGSFGNPPEEVKPAPLDLSPYEEFFKVLAFHLTTKDDPKSLINVDNLSNDSKFKDKMGHKNVLANANNLSEEKDETYLHNTSRNSKDKLMQNRKKNSNSKKLNQDQVLDHNTNVTSTENSSSNEQSRQGSASSSNVGFERLKKQASADTKESENPSKNK